MFFGVWCAAFGIPNASDLIQLYFLSFIKLQGFMVANIYIYIYIYVCMYVCMAFNSHLRG